ncbi:hypothetical protein JTB14_022725 [Gonioctena quinquepunctata]|nr:hypothetical protein JTB14_022725 [Gonioctena quinquepunctata]
MNKMDDAKSNVTVNSETCQKVAQSGLKCTSCGTLSHTGCLELLKSVKYLDDHNILCCDEMQNTMEDEPDGSFDTASDLIIEDSKAMKLRYLKTIIEKNQLLITNPQLNIFSLREHIKLLFIVNNNQPTPSNLRGMNGGKLDSRVLSRNNVFSYQNEKQVNQVSVVETKTTSFF